MSQDFQNLFLPGLLNKWKWHLLGIAVLSALAGVVFSSKYFITPKFKSTAVVYPVNLVPYGEESVAEQLLQLFQSSEVRNAVIKKFDLAKHYEVKSDPANPSLELIREYNDHISINKTEYESVEIVVMDKDPIAAAHIARQIINQMNAYARKIQREKSKEIHRMLSLQLDAKKHEMDSLQNRLYELRTKFGIIDFDRQVKEITKGYINGISKGQSPASITELKNNFGEKGGEYQDLLEKWRGSIAYYNKIKSSYDDVTADIFKELTYANVVTKPYVADNKSYPIRWLIVLVSVLSSLFVCFVLMLILEKDKSLN
jgi:uncharacterized protein involved in exopolysaccharide biosynthesis